MSFYDSTAPAYDRPRNTEPALGRSALDELTRKAFPQGSRPAGTNLSSIQQQLAEAVTRRRHSLAELERVRDRLVPTDMTGMLDAKDLADARASNGFLSDTQSLLDEISELDKQIASVLGSLHELVS